MSDEKKEKKVETPKYLVELARITALEERTLTETDKDFLRARSEDLSEEQLNKFNATLKGKKAVEEKPENSIITALEERTLTETDKDFLRARSEDLSEEQLNKFNATLKGKKAVEEKPENSIDEFPGVTEDRRTARGAKRKADQAKIDAKAEKERQLEADKLVTKRKIYEAEVKSKQDKEKNETLDQKIKRLKSEVKQAQKDAKDKEDKKKP